ncbi:MAG: photosynthesis system II assembly factor Ycf48 [Leptolyngbyaceae bacterium]|nr:photosynthesis system II assembly factor Ycf48 [Leptolyngbyaceae bacterium]
MNVFITSIKRFFLLLAVVVFCSGCASAYLDSSGSNPWETVTLPTEETALDIAFVDRQHGWIVGKRATLLETFDGGKNWSEKRLDLSDTQAYNLTSISFAGNEGWVVGEPSIMLHTTDAGASWERIALSPQLPGTTRMVTAIGEKSAELVTDVGAIYRTEDSGKHWKAMVDESVGMFRNIARSSDGRYITVSSRGNFYSTWEPGQSAWQQHNRTSSRRLQNMGFGSDGRLWLLARGGVVQFSEPDTLENWDEQVAPEFSTSWGLLDLAYRTPDEIWLSGGSGNLLVSTDGGASWKKDRAIENVPSNLYRVVFPSSDQGFILGKGNILLRYIGQPLDESTSA